MTTGVYIWSQTAASNSTADSAINWAEGQAPSSVNDSARAMMSVLAKWRDDISGAITTGGTSSAYTVTSNSGFDTLAHMNGQIVAFVPHTGNAASCTLNVDSLGAKTIRSAPDVDLPTGALITGTPYLATYNSSDAVFYLHGSAAFPYLIPLGGAIPYFGASAPNSAFALPYGQAVSRTTYATLFSLISTTFGTGDGSTTFNLPDLRGRVVAGLDNMGGSSAARLSTAMTSTSMGNTGGAQQTTLGTSNLPPYTPSGSVSVSGSTTVSANGFSNGSISLSGATPFVTGLVSQNTGNLNNISYTLSASGTFTGTAQGGTSTPFNSIPPTMVANFIMRVI